MPVRHATIHDISSMHQIRVSVKENVLSNPSLITEEDYKEYITRRGKGWVCQEEGRIVGFAIIDLQEHNVWALFVHPDHEKKGIGKKLQEQMMHWYFLQTDKPVWLSTEPGSKAEAFYRKAGWQEVGAYGKGEIKFEMSKAAWQKHHS